MTQRSQADWLTLIEKQAESGLSVTEFCKQQNIGATYFYKRRGDLKPTSADKQTPKFIKAKTPLSSNNTIKILHHETRLSLPLQVSPTWIAQLVKALT